MRTWAGTYLRDHLLPDLRLAGWTPDWHGGFPAFQFYMVVPFLVILLIDAIPFVLYGVAFKLVTVLGILTLRGRGRSAGRSAIRARPSWRWRPCPSSSTDVHHLRGTSPRRWRGSSPSRSACRWRWSTWGWSSGASAPGGRAWAAGLLRLVALTHLIPALFAVGGTIVLLGFHRGRAQTRWVLTMAPVAAAIAAFWALLFVWRRAYLNDMGWEKLEP